MSSPRLTPSAKLNASASGLVIEPASRYEANEGDGYHDERSRNQCFPNTCCRLIGALLSFGKQTQLQGLKGSHELCQPIGVSLSLNRRHKTRKFLNGLGLADCRRKSIWGVLTSCIHFCRTTVISSRSLVALRVAFKPASSRRQ